MQYEWEISRVRSTNSHLCRFLTNNRVIARIPFCWRSFYGSVWFNQKPWKLVRVNIFFSLMRHNFLGPYSFALTVARTEDFKIRESAFVSIHHSIQLCMTLWLSQLSWESHMRDTCSHAQNRLVGLTGMKGMTAFFWFDMDWILGLEQPLRTRQFNSADCYHRWNWHFSRRLLIDGLLLGFIAPTVWGDEQRL